MDRALYNFPLIHQFTLSVWVSGVSMQAWSNLEFSALPKDTPVHALEGTEPIFLIHSHSDFMLT